MEYQVKSGIESTIWWIGPKGKIGSPEKNGTGQHTRKLCTGYPGRGRNRGRQRKRWLDDVVPDLRLLGKRRWRRVPRDRERSGGMQLRRLGLSVAFWSDRSFCQLVHNRSASLDSLLYQRLLKGFTVPVSSPLQLLVTIRMTHLQQEKSKT